MKVPCAPEDFFCLPVGSYRPKALGDYVGRQFLAGKATGNSQAHGYSGIKMPAGNMAKRIGICNEYSAGFQGVENQTRIFLFA